MSNEFEALRSTKAYKVFQTEFDKNLLEFEELSSRDLSNDDRSHLMNSFHRVKGGAGFFGLDEIYNIAAKLEDLFAQFPSDPQGELTELQNYLQQLKQEKNKLKKDQED